MYEPILNFWFDEIEPAQWWRKDPDFDALIAQRFGDVHRAAGRCELFSWRTSPAGRLAEVIVLDQFSRNVARNAPGAFANDPLALALAQAAVHAGDDRLLTAEQRNFLYMPYMHSESLVIHDVAVTLFERNGVAGTIGFEQRHRAIIEQFGRYPHRNAILGRVSTPAELEFLQQPDSTF